MDRRKLKRTLRKEFGYRAELITVDVLDSTEDTVGYRFGNIPFIEELNSVQPTHFSWIADPIDFTKDGMYLRFYFSKEDEATAIWLKLAYG